MQTQLPWFIYALGSGWGHLNRAVALGRAIARQHSVVILTNSIYADRVNVWLQQRANWEPVPCLYKIPTNASVERTQVLVQELLLHTPHACLVVDTFPRGLVGELVNVLPQQQQTTHIWVHRDLNPNYIAAKPVLEFVCSWYDAILVPGEENVPLADLPQVIHTSPWLILNADELPPWIEARSYLQIPRLASQPVPPTLLVCAAGQPAELEFFGDLTMQLTRCFPDCTVRCLAATCPPNCLPDFWITHYPGMECWLAADIVIGAAGYNTVYECAALGIPLVAFNFPRLYDRQARRASRWTYWVQQPAEAISAIQTLLQQKAQISAIGKPHQPDYINGAIGASLYIHHIHQAGGGA
ncbi:MAG: hypothetical protein Kow00121_60330 [Elainellaceae cyanobacterium]